MGVRRLGRERRLPQGIVVTDSAMLFEFAHDKHPVMFKRWLRDLDKERKGIWYSHSGWTKEKERLWKKYHKLV